MLSVEQTTDLSIIVQVITGLVSVNGIFLPLPEKHSVLTDVLKLETAVQVVELFFYIFLLRHMSKNISGMAATRYFDWVITTPTMLLTTIIYFKYEEYMEKKIDKTLKFWEFIEENKQNIRVIFICNFLMLLFGYLGETKVIDNKTSTTIGFAFFAITFYKIYMDYGRHSEVGKKMFVFLLVVWGLYGFAAMASDEIKNNSYNTLDIVAKNFFGLYLFYKVKSVAVSSNNVALEKEV